MTRNWFKRAEDISRMNRDVASQAEAGAGTNNEKVMTPLRIAEAAAANSWGKKYKSIIFFITQSGTDAPTLTTLLDEVGVTIEATRLATGMYRVAFSPSTELVDGKTTIEMGQNTNLNGKNSISLGGGVAIVQSAEEVAGAMTAADDKLGNTYIELQVFP